MHTASASHVNTMTGDSGRSARMVESQVEDIRRIPPAVVPVQHDQQYAVFAALGVGHQALAGVWCVAGLDAYRAVVAADQRVLVLQRVMARAIQCGDLLFLVCSER